MVWKSVFLALQRVCTGGKQLSQLWLVSIARCIARCKGCVRQTALPGAFENTLEFAWMPVPRHRRGCGCSSAHDVYPEPSSSWASFLWE